MTVSQLKTSLLKKMGTSIRIAEYYGLSSICEGMKGLQTRLMSVSSDSGELSGSLAAIREITTEYDSLNNTLADFVNEKIKFYAENATTFHKCTRTFDDKVHELTDQVIEYLNARASEEAMNLADHKVIKGYFYTCEEDVDKLGSYLVNKLKESNYNDTCVAEIKKCFAGFDSVRDEIINLKIEWYKEDLTPYEVPKSFIKIDIPEHDVKFVTIKEDSFVSNLKQNIENKSKPASEDALEELIINEASSVIVRAIEYIKEQYVNKVKETVDIFFEDYLNVLNDSFKEISDLNASDLANITLKLEEDMITAELHRGDYRYYPTIFDEKLKFVMSEYYEDVCEPEKNVELVVSEFKNEYVDDSVDEIVEDYEKLLVNKLKNYDGTKGVVLTGVSDFARNDAIKKNLRSSIEFYDKIVWLNCESGIRSLYKSSTKELEEKLQNRQSDIIAKREKEVLGLIGSSFNSDCSREISPFMGLWSKQLETEYNYVRSQCAYTNRLPSEDAQTFYDKYYVPYYGKNEYVEWVILFVNKAMMDKKMADKYTFVRVNGLDGRAWVKETLLSHLSSQSNAVTSKVRSIYLEWDKDFADYEKFAISQCGHYFDDINNIMNKDIIGKWNEYKKKSKNSQYKVDNILEFAKISNVFNYVQKEFIEGTVREAIGFYKFQNSKGVLLETKVKNYILGELKRYISDWEQAADNIR